MIRAGAPSVAPMYDVMCGGVWETVTKNLAQKIAGEGRGDHLKGSHWAGTGFVWDAAGHVVTNDHVVQNARAVAVRFASGEVAHANDHRVVALLLCLSAGAAEQGRSA